jgi:hypothetical protein
VREREVVEGYAAGRQEGMRPMREGKKDNLSVSLSSMAVEAVEGKGVKPVKGRARVCVVDTLSACEDTSREEARRGLRPTMAPN